MPVLPDRVNPASDEYRTNRAALEAQVTAHDEQLGHRRLWLAQYPLGRRHRTRSAGQDSGDECGGGNCHVVGHVCDEPHVLRRRGVEGFAGEERGGQLAPAAASEDGNADDRGGDSDANLGERERDGAVDHHNVTRGHDANAAGSHRAVDDGNGGRSAGTQPIDDVGHRVAGCVRPGLCHGSFLQVCAGTERWSCVREHDRPDVGLLGAIESLTKFGDQPDRERVAVVRRVERDGGHLAIDAAVHEFAHDADCSHTDATGPSRAQFLTSCSRLSCRSVSPRVREAHYPL